MAKPIKRYALIRAAYLRSGSFQIIGVTLEKGGQVYGRIIPGDNVTHVREADVIHFYAEGTDPEFILKAGDRAMRAHAAATPAIDDARRALRDLERNRELAVMDAAKGQ